MTWIKKRKCKKCHTFFLPDPRNANRQKYCSKEECRKASKKASQRKWLEKPQNQDYFRCPENTRRVQQWREGHPKYWRRKASQPETALQDPLITQPADITDDNPGSAGDALQDLLNVQTFVLLGLIAQFTDNALQDNIDTTLQRLQQLGRDIAHQRTTRKGGFYGVKDSYHSTTGAKGPRQFSWVDQRLVRERRIDHCSHPAAALYLFLITVGDAKGLSYYADASIMQRLSMDLTTLQQARENLVQAGLIAWKKPLYQVLSLDEAKMAKPKPLPQPLIDKTLLFQSG